MERKHLIKAVNILIPILIVALPIIAIVFLILSFYYKDDSLEYLTLFFIIIGLWTPSMIGYLVDRTNKHKILLELFEKYSKPSINMFQNSYNKWFEVEGYISSKDYDIKKNFGYLYYVEIKSKSYKKTAENEEEKKIDNARRETTFLYEELCSLIAHNTIELNFAKSVFNNLIERAIKFTIIEEIIALIISLRKRDKDEEYHSFIEKWNYSRLLGNSYKIENIEPGKPNTRKVSEMKLELTENNNNELSYKDKIFKIGLKTLKEIEYSF